MCEHVVPVRILVTDGEMVGNDVYDQSHVACVQRVGEGTQVGLRAELGIDSRRVDYIVSMLTAGARGEAPEVAVVLVSAYVESVPAASSCGAAAVLSKGDVSPRVLAEVWRAAAARSAARERVEEARALRAQAEHQARRSAKNLARGSGYRPADSEAPSAEEGSSSSGAGKQAGHSRS